MRTKLFVLTLLGLFTFSTFVSADEAATPTTVKKEPVAKKKRVIRNKTAAKKSIPLGTASASPVRKQENKSAANWIRELKKKLARAQARQNQIVAVAAVRGDETPDSPPLYWKGKKAAGAVATPEAQEFDSALDAALKGDSAGSVEALETFVGKYPQSPLAEEAKDVIAKLQVPTSDSEPTQQ